LGELLRMVHQMKADGSDTAFDGFRKKNGYTTLRRPQQKTWIISGSTEG
jgi:hypothetical protein